jgi:Tfp pilus assembly protein PilO
MRLPIIKVTGRTLRIIILVFVMEFLLLSFIVYTQQKNIGYLKAQIKQRTSELESYYAIYNKIPQLEETLSSLRTQMREIEWELPTPAYVPTFLMEIENWAKVCNVKITNISPQAPPSQPPPKKEEPEESAKRGAYREEAKAQAQKPASPYETVALNLQVEGNFYAINKFIDGFRRFPKAISLSKLDITPQQTEGGTPILRVSMFLNMAVLAGERK